MIKRLNYLEINSKARNGLAALNKHIASIDNKLRVLVELRVSQINGCVYCVDLHSECQTAGIGQLRSFAKSVHKRNSRKLEGLE